MRLEIKRRVLRGSLFLTVGIVAATMMFGCGTIPNANSATDQGVVRVDVLRDQMKSASDLVNLQVGKGLITDSQGRAYLARVAGELLDSLEVDRLPVNQAWAYAGLYITAGRWEQAKRLLKVAVANPASEDRRVNDTLQLARSEAELGETDQAVSTARTVFDTAPSQKAPILLSVLLEIVPAIQKHGVRGREIVVARLLEDAIAQHQATVVDPASDSGRAFIRAKVFHMRRAWKIVGELYRAANRQDLANEAARRERELAPGPSVNV